MADQQMDPAELEAALKTIQMADQGNPRAIQAIRDHYSQFQTLLPMVQGKLRGAAPGGKVTPADLAQALPPEQAAAAAQTPQASAGDMMANRAAEVLKLLQPKPQHIEMAAETVTASAKPKKPQAAKKARKATYTPMSAPEGGGMEQQLAAGLLNFLQGAGGGEFALSEPQLGAPQDPLKKLKLPSQ
jgi:hypothetical protein